MWPHDAVRASRLRQGVSPRHVRGRRARGNSDRSCVFGSSRLMAATVATVAYLGPRSLRGLSAGPAFGGPTALYVSVARANTHVTFPARVRLVAAMNPCRCGHLGD